MTQDSRSLQLQYLGLCGSDIRRINQGQEMRSLGHEIVGVIDGQQYVVNPIIPCGNCSFCEQGHTNFCRQVKSFGKNISGGFQGGPIQVKKTNLYLVPSQSLEAFVLVDDLACVIHALRHVKDDVHSMINSSSCKVAIVGDGPLAYVASTYLSLLGANVVQVIKNTKRLRHNITGVEMITFREFIASNIKYKLLLECVGGGQNRTLNSLIEKAEPRASVIVLGVFTNKFSKNELDKYNLFRKEINLYGSNSFIVNQNYDDFRESVDCIIANPKAFLRLITHQLSIEEIEKGIYIMVNKNTTGAIKVIFSID